MAWPTLSASIIGAPSSARIFVTVVLPEPIPPITPIVSIQCPLEKNASARLIVYPLTAISSACQSPRALLATGCAHFRHALPPHRARPSSGSSADGLPVPSLQVVEVTEEAATRKQFVEGALLDNQPVAQDQNKIGALDRREAMGDDERRAVAHDLAHSRHHEAFSLGVERA